MYECSIVRDLGLFVLVALLFFAASSLGFGVQQCSVQGLGALGVGAWRRSE